MIWNSSVERAAHRRHRAIGFWFAALVVVGASALAPAVAVFATANTWTAVSPMPGGPRDRLAVATGLDGRVYAFGGYDGTNVLDRVEAYDSRTNTWTTEAPMPDGGRIEMAAATGPDGRIYVIGGENDTELLDRVEAYDPSTNTWTTEASMPGGARGFLAAATGPDGRIYAIGGFDGSRLARVEAYDTSANTWTTLAPMPGGGRSDEGAVTGPDGRIYAIGGSDGTAYISRVEAYDTNTNTWTTVASMPAGGRGDLGAALGPDGRIYVIGGANGPGGSGPLDTVEAYNTSSNTWTSAQPIAAGATSFPSAATGPDGRIYMIGGFDGTNYLARVEAYTTIGGRLTATGANVTATEGKTLSGAKVAGFSDADENTSAGVYAATINWGDAATSSGTVTPDGAGGYSILGSHVYVEDGIYTVTVQITDLDGNTTTATSSAAVADAALTAAGLNVKQANDSVNGVVATFGDADPGGTLGDYTASINWGDGTSTQGTIAASGSGFSVSGTHHYKRDKEKATISVTVRDVGGSHATVATIAKE